MPNSKIIGKLSKALKKSLRRRMSGKQAGFVLPLAMGLGLVMLTLGVTTIIVSQNGFTSAMLRRQSGLSLAVTEGGLARLLVQLKQTQNSALLTRNFDAINPNTNRTYLGPDGILNSGDEETALVDEWSSVPCAPGGGTVTINDSMGNGQYTLKAYRYNSDEQTGTLLIEGQHLESTSYVTVTLSVKVGTSKFPGVWTRWALHLRGRPVVGNHGNLYYDPDQSADASLTDFSAPGDADRSQYLNAVYSGPVDNVEGTIFACALTPTLPYAPPC